ncbi:MAG: hypothetical protein JW996_03400, partial [Candidatus Cloacimonetes bacterium]|nr:hypothetical protein [Candidatus Cloacimonadota bacterium]
MLILSLPYLDPDQIRYYSNKYKSYYALIEYRLDYNRHFDSFPEELLSSRSILTIRDPLEGGKYTADLSGKLAYYRLMIEKYDCLVDLELRNANGHNL